MSEKLEKNKEILLNKETLRKMIIEIGVLKSKAKKEVEPHYACAQRKHRGTKDTLLVSLDCATSQILEAGFVRKENSFTYANLYQHYFQNYGP